MATKTYNTKNYYTRIKNSEVVGDNIEYVRGVIMGIMTSVCTYCTDDDFLTWLSKDTEGVLVDKQTGDHIYHIITTDELYRKFRNIVERWYPNVCEFDIFD